MFLVTNFVQKLLKNMYFKILITLINLYNLELGKISTFREFKCLKCIKNELNMEYYFAFILGQVIPNTQKIVLDASLLNTQHYKVRIKGQSRERSSAFPYTSVLKLLKKELSGHPRLRFPTLLILLLMLIIMMLLSFK